MIINKIQLIGRLGADPEKRTTNNNKWYCRFKLPLTRKYRGDKPASWIVCEAWDKVGEMILDRGRKGALLYIEGELVVDRWEEGNVSKSRPYIRIKDVRFLESREEGPKTEPATEDFFDIDFDVL